MRLIGLLSLTVLAACSNTDGGNSVDVAAAASRAEGDIAAYAASVPSKPAPVRTLAPVVRRAPAIVVAPGSSAAAVAVARRYVGLIRDGRYGDAWALWGGGGERSGMTEAAFAESFAKYASFDAVIGPAGDEDAGAGQRYVTVPVRVTGTLAEGGEFVLEGPIVLHRVTDGIDTEDPTAHLWRIDRTDLKPRPDPAK